MTVSFLLQAFPLTDHAPWGAADRDAGGLHQCGIVGDFLLEL
jgi:hypothetical protein